MILMLSKLFPVMMSLIFLSKSIILMSMSIFFSMNKFIWILDWNLFSTSSIEWEISFIFDKISLCFFSVICLISSSVFLFSFYYMSQEKFFFRFHVLIMFFIMSMSLLVFSNNILSLMLGWDGLGVTSFLLVIYFQHVKAMNAGMLTILSNRIGDLLMLLVISCLIEFGSWAFFHNFFLNFLDYLIVFLLIWATFTKSAQIPFSAWLPAAMAAPTPVSALVHSSTLVTAGVYILIRIMKILEMFNEISLFILIVGLFTMMMAGISATMELDLKKIVALSTLSQLGLMMSTIGLKMGQIAFIHLLTHAFFKALLFLSVGSMIHLTNDYQDIRKIKISSFSSSTISFSFLANMSLMGMPFLAGFFSKDLILEMTSSKFMLSIIWLMMYLAVFLTVNYSLRLLILSTLDYKRSFSLTWENDLNFMNFMGMLLLSPLVVMGGWFLLKILFLDFYIIYISYLTKMNTFLMIFLGSLFSMKWTLLDSKMLFLKNWSWGMMWGLPLISSKTWVSFFLQNSSYYFKNDKTWMPILNERIFLGNLKMLNLEMGHWKILKFLGIYMFMVLLLLIILI